MGWGGGAARGAVCRGGRETRDKAEPSSIIVPNLLLWGVTWRFYLSITEMPVADEEPWSLEALLKINLLTFPSE